MLVGWVGGKAPGYLVWDESAAPFSGFSLMIMVWCLVHPWTGKQASAEEGGGATLGKQRKAMNGPAWPNWKLVVAFPWEQEGFFIAVPCVLGLDEVVGMEGHLNHRYGHVLPKFLFPSLSSFLYSQCFSRRCCLLGEWWIRMGRCQSKGSILALSEKGARVTFSQLVLGGGSDQGFHFTSRSKDWFGQ